MYVTNSIGGLISTLPYHYRLVVSNALGIVRGYDQIFGQGQVVAWGDGSSGDTNVPPGLTNAVAVAGGEYLSVALKADGTVVAWGSNLNGETDVPAGLSNVVAIAAANGYGLALKADGTVTGWGELGNSVRTAYYAGLSNVVAISLGSWDNAAALTRAGQVLLYDLTLTNSSATSSNAVAITSGFYFNEGVSNDGSIFQIPAYTNTVPPTWTNIVALSTAVNNHMVGLQGDGTILDWTNFSFSSYASVPPPGTNFEAVAASGDCGMALDFSGSVHVWGGNPAETNLPAGLTNVFAIAAGNSHSLAHPVCRADAHGRSRHHQRQRRHERRAALGHQRPDAAMEFADLSGVPDAVGDQPQSGRQLVHLPRRHHLDHRARSPSRIPTCCSARNSTACCCCRKICKESSAQLRLCILRRVS